MHALLLAVCLTAAPAPALADAEPVLHVPKLDRAAPLFAWLQRAGARAPLLRPASWRTELSPLLSLDMSDLAQLRAAGIDTGAAATFSFRGEERLSCFTVKDLPAFEARAKQRLQGMGDPWNAKEKGALLVGASVGSRVVGGYVVRGREACTAAAPREVGPLLRQAAATLAKPPPASKGWTRLLRLPGMAYVQSARGAFGVRAEGEKAIAEGVSRSLPGLTLAAPGPTPYALPAPGLFSARLKLGGLADSADAYSKRNLRACRFCDGATNDALAPLAAAVASRATGNAALRVDRFQLKGSLGSEAAQYFALRNVALFELSDAADVKAALEGLEGFARARKTADGVALALPQGELRLGLSGRHFYAANDEAVATAALEALSKGPALPAPRAAEWTVDPARVTQAFSQISLLDVMGSRELAGLFAVGTELSGLLGASALLSGSADVDADGYRWTATWALKPFAAP